MQCPSTWDLEPLEWKPCWLYSASPQHFSRVLHCIDTWRISDGYVSLIAFEWALSCSNLIWVCLNMCSCCKWRRVVLLQGQKVFAVAMLHPRKSNDEEGLGEMTLQCSTCVIEWSVGMNILAFSMSIRPSSLSIIACWSPQLRTLPSFQATCKSRSSWLGYPVKW